MKLILSISAGIILAIVLLTAGCAALVGGAANEAAKSTANEAVADTAPEVTSGDAGQDNARRSAESYLDGQAFSRSGLIEQLQYEGYTRSQAVYGVNQTGL